jgi:hypothetical protein
MISQVGSAWVLPGFLLVGLSLAVPARSELVIMRSGHVVKVDSFEIIGGQVHLELPAGGSMQLSLLQVDRVIEDEIVSDIKTAGDPRLESVLKDFDTIPDTPYGEMIYQAGLRHSVSPRLVAAVVKVESDYRADAVSPKGAAGLLQLMPATGSRFGLTMDQLLDPGLNLDAGVRYLKWLTNHFSGELPLILAGYNAGEASVKRFSGVPPYRETREYIRRVYSALGLTH